MGKVKIYEKFDRLIKNNLLDMILKEYEYVFKKIKLKFMIVYISELP